MKYPSSCVCIFPKPRHFIRSCNRGERRHWELCVTWRTLFMFMFYTCLNDLFYGQMMSGELLVFFQRPFCIVFPRPYFVSGLFLQTVSLLFFIWVTLFLLKPTLFIYITTLVLQSRFSFPLSFPSSHSEGLFLIIYSFTQEAALPLPEADKVFTGEHEMMCVLGIRGRTMGKEEQTGE